MNEIKRQLNQKLGDTSERTASVIQKIEAGKKMKRTAKRSKSSGPIYIAIASFVTVLALFFLLGPWKTDAPTTTNPEPNEENPIVKQSNETSYKDILRKFFKPDGTHAYFKGIGNEYASFNEETHWLSDDYVQIIVDNGGSMTQSVYRLTDTTIELLVSEYAEQDYTTKTIEELEQIPSGEIILEAPFENGKTFDGKVMYTNVEIETLYGKFNAVMTEDQEHPIKRYYTEGLGLVFERYTFEDEYVIEHILFSINDDYNIDPNQTISIYNETTKQEETHLISNLSGIDPVEYKFYPEFFNVTYRKLVDVAAGELGVLSYKCDDKEQCRHIYVHKNGSSFTTIQQIYGSYGNFTISPNNQYVAIPVYTLETKYTENSSTTIEVGALSLIDLEKMEVYTPSDAYFNGYYPIMSHSWKDEKTLVVQVADILNDAHETVYDWQNGARNTKQLTLNLP